MIIIPSVSHLDHGFGPVDLRLKHALKLYSRKEGFFIDTQALPVDLEPLTCELYGPYMGDPPVPEDVVFYKIRGNHKGATRCISKPGRDTMLMTVIAGPHTHEGVDYS